MRVAEEILGFYNSGKEQGRLIDDSGWLERVRTEDILHRHLPPPPARVLDIGGAAGIYALPLAARGYEVHLLDPIPLHVEQAKAGSQTAGHPLASTVVGDARALPFSESYADAVLLLGPLYHLVEARDRATALREAFRVLRPGGRLFAAAISKYASLIDGLSRGLFRDATFASLVDADLDRGQHRNVSKNPDYFTTAFFHDPELLGEEIAAAGFQLEAVLGIEGPVWMPADIAAWKEPTQTELLLRLLRRVEKDRTLVGASAHLIGVGRK